MRSDREVGGMKIGDAARELGVSVQTLRFYEREGLVTSAKSAKGTRVYEGDDLTRVRAIRTLTGLGIPLQSLQQLAHTRRDSDTGDQACRSVSAQLHEFAAQLTQLRGLIDTSLDDIEQADRMVTRCRGCEIKPSYAHCAPCPVSDGLGDAQLLQLIWDQKHDHE